MVQPINVADPPIIRPHAPLFSNISNLKAIVDNDVLGATVSFNVVALTNSSAIFLLRSLSNSILAAKELEIVPVRIGAQLYDDRDPAIVGKQVWYWVQLQSADGLNLYVGPVTVVVKSGTAPHAVNWIEASSNFSADDSVEVNVVCELFAGADASGGVAVFIQHYLGNAAQVLIFQDTSETLSFHLKITGEIVTFYVAAVNAAGSLSSLSTGVNLPLNGAVTKPCRLTGLNALEGNGFTQVSFAASLEPGVTLYRLYRGPFGGTFSGAAVVATLAPTSELQYTLEDNVVNGHVSTYQWYVTAVNPVTGESNPSDAVLPATPWS